MGTLAEIIFWTCAASITFSYVVYPLVVWCASRGRAARAEPPDLPAGELPHISLLIAAHNEEDVIHDRIRNALAMEYPRDRLEVVIALDGCDDRTAEIAGRFVGEGIRLLDYPRRRGKSAVLNEAFDELSGTIVVLSDANTDVDSQAVYRLVRWFEDQRVGAVCGRLELIDPHSGRNLDGLYWKYETFLKRAEGRLGALLGANGAIYAIRKDLFRPIPSGTILDDFVIPLLAKLRSDCSIIYDTSAIAREETPASVRSEFRRRARIGAGGYQSIGYLWRLLDPRRGWIAFAFLSHKVLRWLCPFFMIGAFVSNLCLLDHPPYRLIFSAQFVFYAVSALDPFLPPSIEILKPIRIASMFTIMNMALFVGFLRWIRCRQDGTWARTSRSIARSRLLAGPAATRDIVP
jgi:cellulose synthase/poly-beta-1,6-N-acetylglucosamine synthase-like glycosyltransferase